MFASHRVFSSLVAFSALLLCATSTMAQVTTAEIVGTVTDNSGAVVANATATIKHVATGVPRTMQTSASGTYAFTLLPIGTYSLAIERTGFKKYMVSDVTVAGGDRARLDAVLQLGDVSETVEVVAQSAGALQTDSATVSGLVTTRAVQDLPVNGRNFIKLVQLAPGVTESVQSSLGGGGRPDDRRQTSTVSANGQNDSANNFLLDGMDNNERAIATIIVKPSIDALAEVRVQTSMYSAEVSRAGGAVVNMITKSGANDFHGTLFEFLRNDKFDAKNFFNVPQAGNPLAGKKPAYRQNQFGGSIGGPIKKDKIFFFGDYEGFRKVQGLTQSAAVPTPCQLGKATCNGYTQLGNFSDSSVAIYDPLSHTPYTNNVIPISKISPIAANYAALYPALPSCTGITCNFVSSPSQTQFAHTGDVRIDYHIGNKDSFYGRYSINNTDTNTPDYLPTVTVAGIDVHPNGGPFNGAFPSLAYQRQQSLALAHTHIFTPTLLLQLNAQVARYVTDSESPNASKRINDAFGGPANGNSSFPGTGGLAFMQFQTNGYAPLGDAFALPTQYWDTSYHYAAAITWTKGSHTLKFGANLIRRDWSVFQHLFKNELLFNSAQTNSTAGAAGGTGGNAFASLLAGYPTQVVRNMSMVAPQYRASEIGAFFQDDWRVTHWLTLNLGARYDIFTPLREKHNQLANFDPTNAQMLATGMVQMAGQNGYSDTLGFETQYHDLQPRLGFAATLGKGMVLRGGLGISYFINNLASPAYLKNGSMTSSAQLVQTPGTPTIALATAFPPITPNSPCLVPSCGATGVTSVPAATQMDFHWGTNYMTNLTLEKEFGGNILTLGFVGQPVRHLPRVVNNINLPLPPLGPGGCGATTAISLPDPCQPFYNQLPKTSSIQLMETNGVSNYTALQIQFQRRYRSGLTFAGSYTWSSALSDVSGPGGACTGCAQVLSDLGRDYGPSDYMVKHRITFTANYELPFGKSLKGVTGRLVKGWQVNGLYAYGTGQPFTVMNGSPQQNTPGIQGGDRPNALPQGNFTQSLDQWFDITAFRMQPFGTAGNEGHNTFTMPAPKHLDISLFKDFALTERMKLQFRAEAFNVSNTPSFGLPGLTISGWAGTGSSAVPTAAGNFGKITTMNAFYTPRDIQFALKLLF